MTKAEKTKELIIAKAAPLFNKKGYAGTSMSDIMKATGLAKGGLYGNFESKDEIAALAFEYSYNQLKEDIGQKIKAKKMGVDKLLAIFQYYKNYYYYLLDSCVITNCRSTLLVIYYYYY